ncbi:MAG: VOC family protein [Bacteroidetes bacterium]|nr:MAG: VOC family protein [Bacteroidota bacterium]
MKKVTGIGGIFFKCQNPAEMKNWYSTNLGLQTDEYGTSFEWRQSENPDKKGFTAWNPFPENSSYLGPGQNFMINYRVENLRELVDELKKNGVTVIDEIEVFEYGKFVHILDPEGNKIELWEPNDDEYDKMIDARTK